MFSHVFGAESMFSHVFGAERSSRPTRGVHFRIERTTQDMNDRLKLQKHEISLFNSIPFTSSTLFQ